MIMMPACSWRQFVVFYALLSSTYLDYEDSDRVLGVIMGRIGTFKNTSLGSYTTGAGRGC